MFVLKPLREDHMYLTPIGEVQKTYYVQGVVDGENDEYRNLVEAVCGRYSALACLKYYHHDK